MRPDERPVQDQNQNHEHGNGQPPFHGTQLREKVFHRDSSVFANCSVKLQFKLFPTMRGFTSSPPVRLNTGLPLTWTFFIALLKFKTSSNWSCVAVPLNVNLCPPANIKCCNGKSSGNCSATIFQQSSAAYYNWSRSLSTS